MPVVRLVGGPEDGKAIEVGDDQREVLVDFTEHHRCHGDFAGQHRYLKYTCQEGELFLYAVIQPPIKQTTKAVLAKGSNWMDMVPVFDYVPVDEEA